MDQALPLARAAGALPHAQVGDSLYHRERDAVEGFARRVEAITPGAMLEPLEIDLSLGPMRLTGWLAGAAESGLVGYRMNTIQPWTRLELWVRHLVLNCLAPAGARRVSHWLGEGEEIRLLPVKAPEALLETLLELYWQGLREPLHFFPRSAHAFVEAMRKGARVDPLQKARRIWEGSDFSRGERENLYYQLAFRHADPLDEQFERLAKQVFQPMFEHLGESS